MEIIRTKPLKGDQYYPTVQKKTSIIWHHTGGLNADGAISWWNQTPDKVGTAFVIDRDGKVYQTFDANKWGYHLGIAYTNNLPIEQSSIGIEIAAAGQLHKMGDKFMFYPLFPNLNGGKEIPAEDVWTMGTPWRGETYFHKYSDEQITSLIELTNMLVKDFGIKIQANITDFYQFNKDVAVKNLPGIWSHTTVRETGKWDIVPHKEFLDKVYKAFLTTKTK